MDPRKGMTRDEVCDQGQRIIDETLSKEDVGRRRGQMVAVDVLSGEMGFGRTGIEADEELRKRVQEPVTYLGRVGFRAAYRMGWRSATSVESNADEPMITKSRLKK